MVRLEVEQVDVLGLPEEAQEEVAGHQAQQGQVLQFQDFPVVQQYNLKYRVGLEVLEDHMEEGLVDLVLQHF
jgi:hypothetical protein